MSAAGGIVVHEAWVPLRVAPRARWLKPAPPAMEGCQAHMHTLVNRGCESDSPDPLAPQPLSAKQSLGLDCAWLPAWLLSNHMVAKPIGALRLR